MCVFPSILQLADTYLGSLSLSSFGSRRPLALTMAGSPGCGGPRSVWVKLDKAQNEHIRSDFGYIATDHRRSAALLSLTAEP
jgi:hypothetical protein